MSDPALEAARRHFEASEHEECFWILKERWLAKPDDVEAVALLSELMSAVGKKDLSDRLAKLCANKDKLASDALSLFEAGFYFLDERQPELAAMLLKRCADLAPDDPTVNYELGFALLTLKRYQECIPYLNAALAKIDDFDTRLNLAVAYTCRRDVKQVEEMVTRMAALTTCQEELSELKHQRLVLRRLSELSSQAKLGARDWLYIHYGSVLLKENGADSGKFGQLADDYAEIARTLLMLRGVLEALGCEFDVVEYYSSLSRPLSQALGELMSLPFKIYSPGDQRALLLMGWASDIIGPHEAFIEGLEQRSIFSYALTWRESLPLTPEIAGCLAEACALPWGERYKVEQWDDGRPVTVKRLFDESQGPAESAEKILARASDLEADPALLEAIDKIGNYYSRHRDILLTNSKISSRRPEYTNEIPL